MTQKKKHFNILHPLWEKFLAKKTGKSIVFWGSTNATKIKYINAENGRVILRQYVGVNGEIIGYDWRTIDNRETQTHRSSQTPEQKENRRERGRQRERSRRDREDNDDDDGWN